MVDSSIQSRFPEWSFKDEIARNELMVSYVLKHPQKGRCVLKLFSDKLIDKQAQVLCRYLNSSSKVNHSNLASIYEVCNKKELYILREFIKGGSLAEMMKGQSIPEIRATQIVLDVSQGIFSGYPFGIVYNNIKPSNIIIDQYGIAKLCDYCLPSTNYHYFSPEQMNKEQVGSKSDVYSLAIIYYELIYGEPLFLSLSYQKIKELQNSGSISKLQKYRKDIDEKIYHIICKNLNRCAEKRDTPFHFVKQLNTILKTLKAPSRNTVQIIRKTPTKLDKVPTDADVWEDKDNAVVDAEEILFTEDQFKEHLEETVDKAIDIQLFKSGEPLPHVKFYFPKQYEKNIVEHLLKVFRQECWLLKQTSKKNFLEIDIDLDKGYIQRHYYLFEDILDKAITEAYNDFSSEKAVTISKGNRDETKNNKNLYATYDLDGQQLEEQLEDDGLGTTTSISVLEKDGVTVVKTEKGSVEIDNDDLKKSDSLETFNLGENQHIETLNDITFTSINSLSQSLASISEIDKSLLVSKRLVGKKVTISVDFENRHEATAWVKFVRKYKLYKGKQFIVEDVSEKEKNQVFTIFIDRLKDYEKVGVHIERIKQFFEGDYDITEIDRGGMGAILKLTSKNDNTILSLRPENYWAKVKFSSYLKSLKNANKEQIFYVELPKETVFVVKVGFEGYEESLIQEAKILTSLAESENICNTIIGSVQQGRLFSRDEKEDQAKIGYYLMLEYAHQGNLEQIYKSCPDNRLSVPVAFAIMYGVVQALVVLEEKGIIHRDIKPQNILLDNQGVPKLSDFGLSITTTQANTRLTDDRKRLLRMVDERFCKISIQREHMEVIHKRLIDKQNNLEALDLILQEKIEILAEVIIKFKEQEESRAEELKEKYRPISAEENALKGRFAGSLHYAAPEQFTTDAVLTTACDIYQLGAVMFTMLTGKRPVNGKNTFDIMSKILAPEKPKLKDYVTSTPVIDILDNLISQMMQHNPKDRISISKVHSSLNHILSNHRQSLEKMTEFVPKMALNNKQQNRWDKKVKFAQTLHETCLKSILSEKENYA